MPQTNGATRDVQTWPKNHDFDRGALSPKMAREALVDLPNPLGRAKDFRAAEKAAPEGNTHDQRSEYDHDENLELEQSQRVIVEHGMEFIWQLCPVCEVKVVQIKGKQVCPKCRRIVTACCD